MNLCVITIHFLGMRSRSGRVLAGQVGLSTGTFELESVSSPCGTRCSQASPSARAEACMVSISLQPGVTAMVLSLLLLRESLRRLFCCRVALDSGAGPSKAKHNDFLGLLNFIICRSLFRSAFCSSAGLSPCLPATSKTASAHTMSRAAPLAT